MVAAARHDRGIDFPRPTQPRCHGCPTYSHLVKPQTFYSTTKVRETGVL